MPSGNSKLQQFESPDQRQGDHRGEAPLLRIGKSESDADQNEGEAVIAILAEKWMGTEPRRPKRDESHGSRKQPGEGAEQGGHPVRLAQSEQPGRLWPASDIRVVNGQAPSTEAVGRRAQA